MDNPSRSTREPSRDRGPRPTLGSYELLEEIASSTYARVYRARQRGAPAAGVVAIKRLRASRESDPRCRTPLLREARIGLGLRASGLARVLELHVEPEPFMVCEYVQGASLRKLLARRSGSPTAQFVVPVLMAGLRALHALHRWRREDGVPSFVVHQAPSARHLLVSVEGVTRLIDLSHATGPAFPHWAQATRRLHTGETAPEQWTDPEHVDPRCDLFIVGVTLWEALTGRPLFETGAQPPFSELTSWRAPLPSEAGAQVAAFDEVCMRALALRRDDRYWSAEEMAHALAGAARRARLWAGPEELAQWVRSTLGYPRKENLPRPADLRVSAGDEAGASRTATRAETVLARATTGPLEARPVGAVTETARPVGPVTEMHARSSSPSLLPPQPTVRTERPRARRLSRIVFPLVLMPIVLLVAMISRGQRPLASSTSGAQAAPSKSDSGREQHRPTQGAADPSSAREHGFASHPHAPIPLVYELRPTNEQLAPRGVGGARARAGAGPVRAAHDGLEPADRVGGPAPMRKGGFRERDAGASDDVESAYDWWFYPRMRPRRDPLPANPY